MPLARRSLSKIACRLAVLAAAAVTLTCAGAPAAAAATPPATDPFYSYGSSLANVAPGTVLRTRQVQISFGGSPQAYPATQILYRTTNQLGAPTATVATLIRPAGAGVVPTKLLSYQTFYDGLATTCRPSYTLRGGDPGNTTANADETLMLDYVQQGYTVVTSDYEGPTDDYGAGRESGYGTLDAIRAAEHYLGLTAGTTPVGLVGYSGGSIASDWAGELQSSYAPGLHLIGIAEGGVPADYVHTLAYIDGSADWAGAIPAVTIGLARAYKLDMARYFTPQALGIFKHVEQGCLNPTAYPGLKFASLLKPRYRDWKKVPSFIRIFNDGIMGRAGTPRVPLLLGVGNADGTGDGVMIVKDVQELSHTYCTRGLTVQFHVYGNSNHDEAAPQFEAQAVQFLQQLYGGQPVASECSSIPAGNPLTPLPPPSGSRHASAPRVLVRSVKVSHRRHGLLVVLATNHGTVRGITVELKRGNKVLLKKRLARLGTGARRLVLRINGRIPAAGRYKLVILEGRATVVRRGISIGAHRR